MPRQRKPQNGGQRVGTWRVANTTTGSTTTQAVYRIPTGKRYGECEVLNYEVVGTSPVRVAIEWSNVYRVSLDEAALKQLIESYDNLDLSNVTLQTVNGNVIFTGNINSEGIFTWTTVNATDVNTTNLSAASWDITNLTSSSLTTNTLTASSTNTDSLSVTNNATVGGTLGVEWNTTLSNLSVNSDLSVAGNSALNTMSATSADIDSLTADSIISDTLEVHNGANVQWWLVSDTLNVSGTTVLSGNTSATNINASGTITTQDLNVNWNEVVAGTLWVAWATSLNSSLTVAGASTLSWNASVGGNLSVAGNETVTGNSTVTGDAIFSNDVSVAHDITVSWDATIADDLTVNWTSHLKDVETKGSVDIDWTLRTTWAANIGNGIVVSGQVEADTVRTSEVVSDEVRVTDGLYLSADAEAPSFVLQSEKNQPNGVAALDANGQISTDYLPPVYTSAIVKMGTWVFSNSDTCVVVDDAITEWSFVALSNYQDIEWDLNEVVNAWQITVISNAVETWSFKYIIVNPAS